MDQPGFQDTNLLMATVFAFLPIICIFSGLLIFKISSHIAGLISLGLCAVVAVLLWGMPVLLLLQSVAEGIALGLWPIVWVIFAAIFTYNLMNKSGALVCIRETLSGISNDRRIQVLIIAFAFGGFLEATAGFGTAVAIPAGILIILGFQPLFASVICLVANTVPVALGVVGIPVITLSKVTGLPLERLALHTALQLLPFTILLPLLLAFMVAGSWKGMKGVKGIALAGGITFGTTQTLVAWLVGPELSSVAGSVLSLVVLVLFAKRMSASNTSFSKDSSFSEDSTDYSGKKRSSEPINLKESIRAWSPYVFIFVLVLSIHFFPFFNFLKKYPFEPSYRFYSGPGGKPVSFSLLTNPGSIILISSILGGFVQRVHIKTMLAIAAETARQVFNTAVTVLSLVSLAKIMGYSGMISVIAISLSKVTGSFFPLISPLVGAIGTFITGSDTSSNVLFGELQKQTAQQIGADPSWIAAANASGGALGKMISPQSIAIAVSATGQKLQEAKILAATLRIVIPLIILLGVFVYASS